MKLLSYTLKISFKLNYMSARSNNISHILLYFVSDVYKSKDDDIEHVCEILMIPDDWHEGFCKSALIDEMMRHWSRAMRFETSQFVKLQLQYVGTDCQK